MTNEMPANFGSSRISFGTCRKTKASRSSGTQMKAVRDGGESDATTRIVPCAKMNGRPSVIGALQWVSIVVEKPLKTTNLAPFRMADTWSSFLSTPTPSIERLRLLAWAKPSWRTCVGPASKYCRGFRTECCSPVRRVRARRRSSRRRFPAGSLHLLLRFPGSR